MTVRLYLDEYYSKGTGRGRNPDFNILRFELIEKLENSVPDDVWDFGLTTIASGIERCIYFTEDHYATAFVLKSGIDCYTIYEK